MRGITSIVLHVPMDGIEMTEAQSSKKLAPYMEVSRPTRPKYTRNF